VADYQAIIDAIDLAILSWAGKPKSLSVAGKSITYQTMGELMLARDYYTGLLGAASASAHGFRLTQVKLGGPV
jgi:hypothetical protein